MDLTINLVLVLLLVLVLDSRSINAAVGHCFSSMSTGSSTSTRS
ncbi:MAG: hypothetical protein AAF492_16970 [Verrucomicrobiota bacterium]